MSDDEQPLSERARRRASAKARRAKLIKRRVGFSTSLSPATA